MFFGGVGLDDCSLGVMALPPATLPKTNENTKTNKQENRGCLKRASLKHECNLKVITQKQHIQTIEHGELVAMRCRWFVASHVRGQFLFHFACCNLQDGPLPQVTDYHYLHGRIHTVDAYQGCPTNNAMGSIIAHSFLL